MLLRTMLKAVAVVGVFSVAAGSALAHGPRVIVHGSHTRHYHVQQPHVHVYHRPVHATPSYGYGFSSCRHHGYAGPGYGGYGGYSGSPYGGGYYGSPYGGYGSYGGIGYGGSGFGIYYSR